MVASCDNFKDLTLLIASFIQMEMLKDPLKYTIDPCLIPMDNPSQYVDYRLEKIRQALMTAIIRVVLQRQSIDSKVLLMKLINVQLMDYLNELRRTVLTRHFRSWYTITWLMENKSV